MFPELLEEFEREFTVVVCFFDLLHLHKVVLMLYNWFTILAEAERWADQAFVSDANNRSCEA
jgi:hypothetical protein